MSFVINQQNDPNSSGEQECDFNNMKKIQRWPKKSIKELILDLKMHGCLWDMSNPYYSDRYIKERARQDLANKYNCTVDEIKKKLTSLRFQLTRELKKVKPSGEGTGEHTKRSEWEHWESLQFLVPAIMAGKMGDTSTVQEHSASSTTHEEHDTKESLMVQLPPLRTYPSEIHHTPGAGNKRTISPSPTITIPEKKIASSPNTMRISDKSTNTDNEVSYFCKNLDVKLKGLSYRERLLLEKKIYDLVFEAEFKSLYQDEAEQSGVVVIQS